MTPEQRKAARETFQGMRKLPPEKQHELRERWLQKHEAREAERSADAAPESHAQSEPEPQPVSRGSAAPREPRRLRAPASRRSQRALRAAHPRRGRPHRDLPLPRRSSATPRTGWRRHLLQAWVLGVVGAYFVWFWTHGGQTLADEDLAHPPRARRRRPVGARPRAPPLPARRPRHRGRSASGFVVGLFDRDRQFLHDRLAGTALVDAALERSLAPLGAQQAARGHRRRRSRSAAPRKAAPASR